MITMNKLFYGLFAAFIIKVGITGCNWQDVILASLLLGNCCFIALLPALDQFKKLQKSIDDHKDEITILRKEYSILKDSVSSVRLSGALGRK